VGRPEGKVHLEDLDVNGRIIVKRLFKKRDGKAWIDLAQDRGRWRVLVKAVMALLVP